MKGPVATVTVQHYPHGTGLRCRHSKGEGRKGDPGSRPTQLHPQLLRLAKAERQSQIALLTNKDGQSSSSHEPRGHLNNSENTLPSETLPPSHWESCIPSNLSILKKNEAEWDLPQPCPGLQSRTCSVQAHVCIPPLKSCLSDSWFKEGFLLLQRQGLLRKIYHFIVLSSKCLRLKMTPQKARASITQRPHTERSSHTCIKGDS